MKKASCHKSGFTLIEILMVIVVISVLAGIVMGAASYMTRLSRSKRLSVTRTVLETAIYRYRAEYGEWPLPPGKEEVVEEWIQVSGEDNKYVFGPLRATSERNPDGIQFLDETTVLTWNKNEKKVVPLSQMDRGQECPLLYIDGNGKYKSERGEKNYFKVTFNTEEETVTVGTR